jgi:hypothetical protein
MHRQAGQLSWADGWVAAGVGAHARLERIERLIDWTALAAVVAPIDAAPTGRPSSPPLLMVRALLLQQGYGLSDPGLEEALADRLSFRRFVGLALDQPVPDHDALALPPATRRARLGRRAVRRGRAAARRPRRPRSDPAWARHHPFNPTRPNPAARAPTYAKVSPCWGRVGVGVRWHDEAIANFVWLVLGSARTAGRRPGPGGRRRPGRRGLGRRGIPGPELRT